MEPKIKQSTDQIVRASLAAHLGVEADDISLDDNFKEDLHMQPGEIVEYMQELTELGLEASELDLTVVRTVGDLVDSLKAEDFA